MRRGGEGQVLGTGGPGGLCSSGFSCAALPRAAKSLPPRSLSSRSRGRIKPACCGLAGSPLGGVWHPAPPPGPGGPGRAPLGSPPWCWGGDGRGHPGGRGQGSVHPGHRPPEALGTFPHGLTHGYRATPASPRRDATSLLREPPTLSGRSAALWVPPPPPSSACGPRWGVPPTAALSCFLWSGCKLLPSKVTFALGPSVHPPPCAVVPTAGTEALEKDRAAATNGSWCPVAGGHACTHVPAPGRRPPRSRRARVRP